METIAYSVRSGNWITRYSFTPTCYATIDNDFLSFNSVLRAIIGNVADEFGGVPETNRDSPIKTFWIHKNREGVGYLASWGRNRFYNMVYPTTVTVASNENPSANKIFKAISLETNSSNWTASFVTNSDSSGRGGTSGTEYQSSRVEGPFIEREGNRYIAIPKAMSRYSTANTAYLGSTIPLEEIQDPLPNRIYLRQPPISSFSNGIGHTLTIFGVDNTVNSPDPFVQQPIGFVQEDDGETPFQQSYVNDPDQDNLLIKILGYDDQAQALIFGTYQDGVLQDWENNVVPDLLADSSVDVYVTTPPQVDGDFMRGKFCTITLSHAPIDNAADPSLELFAINVEHEGSNLDHKLGN